MNYRSTRFVFPYGNISACKAVKEVFKLQKARTFCESHKLKVIFFTKTQEHYFKPYFCPSYFNNC